MHYFPSPFKSLRLSRSCILIQTSCVISKCQSVRSQTHSDTVWLAIRTHCGSRSRLSYYRDGCCGVIFETELAWPLCDGRIGSVSPGGPEAVGWFHRSAAFFVSFSIGFHLTGFINTDGLNHLVKKKKKERKKSCFLPFVCHSEAAPCYPSSSCYSPSILITCHIKSNFPSHINPGSI